MTSYNKLSKITLMYIMVLGLFSRYTEHYYIWKLVFLLLFFALFNHSVFRKQFYKLILNRYFIASIVIAIFSIICSPNNAYLFSNFNLLLWPVLFMITIVVLFLSSPVIVKEILKKALIPLNAFLIVNLIVLTIQCCGVPLLIKESWMHLNSYYADLCCGFFGYNGTHELTTYLLFMNTFNLFSLDNLSIHKNKFFIYICVTNILIILTSTKNDNIAIYFLLPLFLITHLVLKEYLKSEKITVFLKKMRKYIILFFLLLIIVTVLPLTRDFINKYVLIRVKMVVNVTNPRYQINGSNERLAIPLRALCNRSGWLVGEGIGAASYGGGDFFGYRHFGLSSIGSLVMTGGVWCYLTYTLFYAVTISKMIKTKHKFPIMICFSLMVLLTVYTILYTSFVSTIWITLYFMVLACEAINLKKEC